MAEMGAWLGMLIVETIAKVRRAYFVQKKSIKEVCREFGLSRKVVRKVIRSEETEFRYERSWQPRPRIDAWRDQLDGLLLANAEKPTRERLTVIRVFEALRGLGYEGGYDSVRRYARVWRAVRGEATARAYVPLSFAPGEAYQFDWSHEIVLVNRVPVTVKVAHVRLCHSRMPLVRAYPRESQEMVFDAHARAFEFFKGACTRGIYNFVPGNKIIENDARHPIPGAECSGVAAQEVLHLRVEEEAKEDLARVAQHDDEGHQRTPGAPDHEVTEMRPLCRQPDYAEY